MISPLRSWLVSAELLVWPIWHQGSGTAGMAGLVVGVAELLVYG